MISCHLLFSFTIIFTNDLAELLLCMSQTLHKQDFTYSAYFIWICSFIIGIMFDGQYDWLFCITRWFWLVTFQCITLAPCGGRDGYYMFSTVKKTTLQAYSCSQSFLLENNVFYQIIMWHFIFWAHPLFMTFIMGLAS